MVTSNAFIAGLLLTPVIITNNRKMWAKIKLSVNH